MSHKTQNAVLFLWFEVAYYEDLRWGLDLEDQLIESFCPQSSLLPVAGF